MDRPGLRMASMLFGAAATVAAFLFVFPMGCAAVEGMPSWEKCVTFMGTPAFSLSDFGLDNTWDILTPLVVGVGVGVLSWLAMAFLSRDRS